MRPSPAEIVVKTLRADRQSSHASIAVAGRCTALDGARISFHRYFDIVGQCKARLTPSRSALSPRVKTDWVFRRPGRCCLVDVRGTHGLPLQICKQRFDVALLRRCFTRRVRIKIAIRTLSHTPRQVHVQRKWRRLHAKRCSISATSFRRAWPR